MIGIDWGSSGFRAYRLGRDGAILDRRFHACGIAALQPGEHAALLQRGIHDWLTEDDDGPVLLCGMIGSRQGWVEVPYLPCPVAPADLARHMTSVDMAGRTALIVPGLSCERPDGSADVMRGEETQIFGLDPPAVGPAMLCMPGTHSKHVWLRDGRVERFATAMTGELFALLSRHSLLAPMLQMPAADSETDAAAFAAGVMRSGRPGGLLQHLFGIRADRLFDRLPAVAAADLLSGLLIGHELRGTDWSAAGGWPITIVAAPDLARRYHLAYRALGIAAQSGPEDAAAAGLYRLGRMIREDLA
jgi:2-dehydro-3-deoxygalactonokinase